MLKTTLKQQPMSLFYYFLSTQKIKIIILMGLFILTGLIPSIDSVLLKNITDTIEAHHDDKASDLMSVMLYWCIAYALWWESINITWRVIDYVYLSTMPKIKGKILDDLYNYTQYHSHRFFQDTLAGHITNRITEGARSFEIVFAIFNEKIMHKTAVIVFALVTMYSVHAVIANVFLIWICIFIGLSVFCANTINKYSTAYGKNKALVAGKIVDSVANISAVRMFTSHKFERRYLRNFIDVTVKSDQSMQWFMFKLRYVLGFSCSIMIFSIMYYLTVLRSQLLISIGDCVLVLTLCLSVADDIWDLTQEIGDMFEEIGSFIQSVTLIQPYIITNSENAKELIISDAKIEFKNVTFYYRHNKNIFNNKSVFIPGGQKVGLVGFSGSGKTTFVSLICRLHDIETGQILIDGQDIRDVTQDSLRENISVIPQEPILFHRTIMENIRYGRKSASDEEVMEAAKIAHIHEFIEELPQKYETLCGERGNNLSGGQRQRIIIARAALKDAPILILDEATSSLDSKTEGLIQDSLKHIMTNKTVLVIAHRLSTLLNMDRILVFDRGNIVEDGTHDDLQEKAGLYKKLWDSQVNGFIADNND